MHGECVYHWDKPARLAGKALNHMNSIRGVRMASTPLLALLLAMSLPTLLGTSAAVVICACLAFGAAGLLVLVVDAARSRGPHLAAGMLALALALSGAPVATASAQPQPDSATRIDAYMRNRLPTLRTPGVSVVVVQGDHVTFSRGYGFADRDSGLAMTEDTLVPVASTSKGITALAMMQLVEQGSVDLDAPAVRYLPDFRTDDARAERITVRQLLTHTAGVPAGWYVDLAQDDRALERHVAALENVALHRDPGSGYEYSNDGYSVAGMIVQTVSGQAYEDYVATHVLTPLGMKHSTFHPALAAELGLTTGYAKWHGAVLPGPHALSRGGNPAGGLITTARDVGNYFIALLNDGAFDGAQVISGASLAQMWQPEPASGGDAYGLGWSELHMPGVRLVLHAGDLSGTDQFGGSASQFLLVPERHIGIGVLANMSSLEKVEIAQDVLALLLEGEPAARPIPADWRSTQFTPHRERWTAYIGEYQTAVGLLRVYREGERLLGLSADVPIEFVPQSDSQFVMLAVGALDEAPVEFTEQPDGTVVILWQGQPLGVKK